MTAIPVIASFSADGQIKPLYVRINGADLKVLQFTMYNPYNIPTFNCIVDDSDVEKHIKISYNLSQHTWFFIQ